MVFVTFDRLHLECFYTKWIEVDAFGWFCWRLPLFKVFVLGFAVSNQPLINPKQQKLSQLIMPNLLELISNPFSAGKLTLRMHYEVPSFLDTSISISYWLQLEFFLDSQGLLMTPYGTDSKFVTVSVTFLPIFLHSGIHRPPWSPCGPISWWQLSLHCLSHVKLRSKRWSRWSRWVEVVGNLLGSW